MSRELSDVREALGGVTARFDRRYWLECTRRLEFPRELWEALAKADLLGITIPERYGGVGGGLTEAVAVMEGLARAGMPLFSYILLQNVRELILHHGSDAQREENIPPSVRGERTFAFAITEPEAGTNTFAISTNARREPGGDWVLNGQKVFISAADTADVMVVVAKTAAETAEGRPGFGLLLVDPRSPGIEMHPLNIAVPSPERQFSVFFTDVRVPSDAVIGEELEGFRYVWSVLNPERLLTAATQIGIGSHVLARAVDYAKQRAPFGTPIGAYQSIQHRLAHAHASLEAARLMMYEAAATYDRGENPGSAANIAKLLASEASVEACEIALQVHGGSGWDTDTDIITFWPLARLSKVGPINNEMILNFIGEHVLGLPKSY
jgi:acyl-CoA dehydrogenase